MIKYLKRLLKSIDSMHVMLYRSIWMRFILWVKCQSCISINDFHVYDSFTYGSSSIYPAIMASDKSRAKKIYAKHTNLDANGIPSTMVKGNRVYRPVTITQYGLVNYNFFTTYHDDQYRDQFLKVCDWLCDHINEHGIWPHTFNHHSNAVNADLIAPWCSSMVQGQGISCLVRGFFLTSNEKYLDIASRALSPFTQSTENGGVRSSIYGMTMYEKYPTIPGSCILNGFIFALYGLYDLSETEHDSASLSKQLFDDGINTLKHILPLYDDRYCSLYDLGYITAAPTELHRNAYYHWIHVNQLIAINSISPSPIFEYYIKKWK